MKKIRVEQVTPNYKLCMPYNEFDLEILKSRLEQAKLAGFIYQHQQHILVLQEPYTEDGSPLNIYIQHELTADQIGLQFGLRKLNGQWEYLLGMTYSNQQAGYEIGAGNLRGDQKLSTCFMLSITILKPSTWWPSFVCKYSGIGTGSRRTTI